MSSAFFLSTVSRLAGPAFSLPSFPTTLKR